MVLTALKKNLEGKSTRWVEELPIALWAVCTSARGSTGETPYALVYSLEAVAPAELVLPTYRIETFEESRNNHARALDLDLLEERRITTKL